MQLQNAVFEASHDEETVDLARCLAKSTDLPDQLRFL